MLTHLSIKNMAIIESLQLDLQPGMTVLTGETGAGKSIIIDAISLLIGDRASTDLIRHHEDMAVVEGIFEVEANDGLKKMLGDLDIEMDGQIVIKRTIRRATNGQIRVNGQLVTASHLRQIGAQLIDIHVQHDTHRLFSPEFNYEVLDNMAIDDSLRELNKEYAEALQSFIKSRQDYLDYRKNSEEVQARLDLIQFQKNELEKANLKIGELDELEKRRSVISNSDKLHSSLTSILQLVNDEGGALEQLYDALHLTTAMQALDPALGEAVTTINDIYYGLEEYAGTISHQLGSLSYEPEELEALDARISVLQQLKRKYRMEVEEIISYYEKISSELAQVEDGEHYGQSLVQKVKETNKHLLHVGERLNEARKSIAGQIKTSLIRELADLQLSNSQFDVQFTRQKNENILTGTYYNHGLYDIQFLLSTNKGEPLKPLHKVASGGELSRVMLALKTILNRGQLISTIIFDEIDTGVSGLVASSIGSKMLEIAKTKQILCITHLPQVASLARQHIHVSKYEKANRTVTRVKELDLHERTLEIARMLSGEDITESAMENARQLLHA
ncbi:MAG: DNA repair protein RecN [Turicibacter sp.]|nr:DNA repair protein RecN [Turicibacter sp.]